MSLIKRKESKTEAHYGVVTCPNCGARIKLKTMKRRYIVSLLFLAVIFASIVYLNRNIPTTSSTSLSSSQPKSVSVIEKIDEAEDEAEKVEAESLENAKAEAEAATQAKVEAQKAKAATQRAEAEQAKLAIKQKVNRSWIRPASATAVLKCTIRVRLLSDGTVMDAEVISSSGDEDFGRSAENAVN